MSKIESLELEQVKRAEDSVELKIRAAQITTFFYNVVYESKVLELKHTKIQFKYVTGVGCFCLYVKAAEKKANTWKLILTGPHVSNIKFIPINDTSIEIWTQQNNNDINMYIQEYFENYHGQEFPLSSLKDDDDLVDFKLITNEENDEKVVKVHKAVLAASSPVLYRMLCSNWKESQQAHMEVTANLATLEAFKQYLYTRQLPQDILLLEQMINFGSYYMMPDLENRAIDALARLVTSENAYEILEFAFQNKAKKLSIALFKKMGNSMDLVKLEASMEELTLSALYCILHLILVLIFRVPYQSMICVAVCLP